MRTAIRKNKSTVAAVCVIAVLLIVLFSGAIFVFQRITHDTIHQVTASYLDELGGTLNNRILEKAENSCNEMLLVSQPLARLYETGYYKTPQDASIYLARQCNNCDIMYFALISRDGMCYGSDGQTVRLAEPDTVSEWLSREKTFITSDDIQTMALPLDDTLFYYFVAINPFQADGQNIVAMIGGLETNAAARVLGNDIGNSDASVVTADGDLMFYPDEYASVAQGGNLLDLLEQYADFTQEESIEDIRAAMGRHESYQTMIMLMGEEQYLYLRPLESTDLYIAVAMPAHFSDASMTRLSSALLGTAILVIVCVVIAAFLFTYLYARSLRNSRQLLAEEKERAELASDEARQASMAKSDFLSRMSHEIRTPLSGVIGMTEVALRSVGDDERTRDSLKKIDLSSKHLLTLINDILDMSKIEQGKMEITNEPFSLKALIETIDTVIKEQASMRKLHFKTIVDPSIGTYYLGDQLHLSQILYNLLSNSLKFTPEKGFIILHISKINGAEEDQGAQRPQDPAAEPAPDWLRFVVSDTGCGIDEEFLKIIFDPFEQENSSISQKYGGTGLGLAITKRFSEMMGGDIEVSSTLGKGAVFTLTLPFVPDTGSLAQGVDDAGAARAHVPGAHVAMDAAGMDVHYDFSPYRVLVVEDNELNREIAFELIGMTGASVEEAENGVAAVERFAESVPGYYDLILMDIQMPVMDGYEATRAIRALNRSDAHTVPIIAMTANAFQEDVDRCIEAGMNGHISKPLDTRVMFATMKRMLEA